MSNKFEKREWEEIYRYHEFKRSDGNGWLITGETIVSPTITVTEKNSTIAIAGMIDNIEIDGTQISYLVKGGTKNKDYILYIQITTSLGQKLEDVVEMSVVNSAPI